MRCQMPLGRPLSLVVSAGPNSRKAGGEAKGIFRMFLVNFLLPDVPLGKSWEASDLRARAPSKGIPLDYVGARHAVPLLQGDGVSRAYKRLLAQVWDVTKLEPSRMAEEPVKEERKDDSNSDRRAFMGEGGLVRTSPLQLDRESESTESVPAGFKASSVRPQATPDKVDLPGGVENSRSALRDGVRRNEEGVSKDLWGGEHLPSSGWLTAEPRQDIAGIARSASDGGPSDGQEEAQLEGGPQRSPARKEGWDAAIVRRRQNPPAGLPSIGNRRMLSQETLLSTISEERPAIGPEGDAFEEPRYVRKTYASALPHRASMGRISSRGQKAENWGEGSQTEDPRRAPVVSEAGDIPKENPERRNWPAGDVFGFTEWRTSIRDIGKPPKLFSMERASGVPQWGASRVSDMYALDERATLKMERILGQDTQARGIGPGELPSKDGLLEPVGTKEPGVSQEALTRRTSALEMRGTSEQTFGIWQMGGFTAARQNKASGMQNLQKMDVRALVTKIEEISARAVHTNLSYGRIKLTFRTTVEGTGRVQIEVSREPSGALMVFVRVQNEDLRDRLLEASPQIRQTLAKGGVQLARLEVEAGNHMSLERERPTGYEHPSHRESSHNFRRRKFREDREWIG